MARSKKDKLSNEYYQQINFSERLNDVSLWISKARELLYAATQLKPVVKSRWEKIKIENGKIMDFSQAPNTQGVYFMLVAYALENLCKSILVHRNRASLKNRLLKNVPPEIKGHDLLKLAKNIGLTLNITTEELLVRLSRNSIWAARYPIPIESWKMTPCEKVANEQQIFAAFFTLEDVNKIDGLINRFKNLIKVEIKVDI